MPRQMFDAAFPPETMPEGCVAAAGYLAGGLAAHAWTTEEWARVRAFPETSWVLPIRVAQPGEDGAAAGAETAARAAELGVPGGVAVALDVEEWMAAELSAAGYHRQWAEAVAAAGYVPMIYTSLSALPMMEAAPHPGTLYWVADWTGHEHELAGAAAVQWSSPTVDPALRVDLSTVADAVPLWPRSSAPDAGGGPVAPTLNAPVVAIVATPTGAGYWLVAADGGVFSFGDAQAFPHDPIPAEHLARPVVGAACTPKGHGLYLAGADGGVFTLGSADYHGSIPAEGIAAAPEQ